MRIGIYQRDGKPEDGGAHTFESEVIGQLSRCTTEHEFVSVIDRPRKTTFPAIKLKSNVFQSAANALCTAISRPALFDKGAQLREAKVDILYSPTPCIPCFDIPFFTTCWDLQHRLQPFFPEVSAVRRRLTSAWDQRERHFSTMLPRAAGIIVGTEVGKREIVHFYGVAPERVHVTPFFVPGKLANCQAQQPEWLPDCRFLVYPAQFWPHKNHLLLLKSLKLIHQAGHADLMLVLPGSDKPAEFGTLPLVRELAAKMGLESSIFTPGFVSDTELRWLYEHAEALAFVSHFGPDNLPPLEAMSLGCPVVAAKVPGAREQLHDGALLADPTDETAIAESLMILLNSPEKRKSQIVLGRSLTESLTIQTYVAKILSLFDEFAKIRGDW